jgi:hypothetical protein
MLLDEIDNFLDDNRKDAFSILNSGHELEGAHVNRCDPSAEGKYKATRYCTWAPCVLAGIAKGTAGAFGSSKQAAALESRCIVITLKRKLQTETVQFFDDDAKARCAELGRQAAAWCKQNEGKLRNVYPIVPQGLYNRETDSWRSLLKFADAAGGRWPQLAREAAQVLNGKAEDPSEGVMLLRDTRNAFTSDRISTAALLNYLHGVIERPWGRKGLGDTEPEFQSRQLAAALKPFGILSKSVRMRDGQIVRGYGKDQFEDAWARYCPPEDPEEEFVAA